MVECYLHTVEVTGSNPVSSKISSVSGGDMEMGILSDVRYRYVSQTATVETLLKEFFRKLIHICAAFVPIVAKFNLKAACIMLAVAIPVYSVCEIMRLNGINVPVISKITAYAARSRDYGHFVLGPVTMAVGILLTLLFFPLGYATIGILALAFGDGTASLAGKLFGKRKIPGTNGKTVEGSLSCFIMVFLTSLLITRNFFHALFLGLSAAVFEALPIKDYDNLIIPLLLSFLAAVLDSFSLF